MIEVQVFNHDLSRSGRLDLLYTSYFQYVNIFPIFRHCTPEHCRGNVLNDEVLYK